MLDPGDGDGWTHCAHGHRHWGVFGAAGLLLWHADRVLLQHRATWSHHGGTWGIPGGARHRSETAVEAALREAAEETGLGAAGVRVVAESVVEHGGWAYTTIIARVEHEPTVNSHSPESIEVRWVPAAEVAALPLHPGFAASWDALSAAAPPDPR